MVRSWLAAVGVAGLAWLAGCADVSVIGKTANLNQKNAVALDTELGTFLSENERVFKAFIDLSTVETIGGVASAVQDESEPVMEVTDKAAAAKHFADARTAAQAKLDALPSDADRQAMLARMNTTRPLLAAMLSGQLSPEQAADMASMFNKRMQGAAKAEVNSFVLVRPVIAALPACVAAEQAGRDVLAAYQACAGRLRAMSGNNVMLADAFVMAATTKADPSSFVRGLAGDEEVKATIGDVLTSTIKDPKRLGAAQGLLDKMLGVISGGLKG